MATIDDVLTAADEILQSSPGKGAALGALAGQLLSSYGQGAGGVNLGVDMSKVGAIPGRVLSAYQPKYRTYAEYGARDLPLGYIDPNLARALGVSSLIPTNLGQQAQYTARPAMGSTAPLTVTSAGSGASRLLSPTLTATKNNTISPLTGALLGAAVGALASPSATTVTGASGGGGGGGGGGGIKVPGGLTGLYKSAVDWVKSLGTPTGGGNVGTNVSTGSEGQAYWTDKTSGKQYSIDLSGKQTLVYDPATGAGTAGGYDASQFGGDMPSYYSSSIPMPSLPDYSNADVYEIKDGGLVPPLMADGGAVDGYYTYGTPINPADIMNQMSHGGAPHKGGLQATVEGRMDYRDGAAVTGAGDGQSDDIPAMLAEGEFVIDSETVAQLGNGSTKAGSNLLDEFRKAVREHKRSAPVDKIPPASSPLQYMKTAMQNVKERNRG